MQTIEPRTTIAEPTRPSRRWSTVVLAIAVAASLSLGGWRLVGEFTGADRQIEQLVSEWDAAWNAGDGEGVVALMTPSGRHVCSLKPAPGAGGDELAQFVRTFKVTYGYQSSRIGDPVVVESRGEYLVTVPGRGTPTGTGFSFFRIVERDGEFLVSYHEWLH